MVEYVKLYKCTATGSVQVWWMERDDDKYRMCSGKHEGKITRSAWTVAEAKNVGRANATDAVQQAALEVEAKYAKQKKAGYSEEFQDASTRKFHPMLAQHYEDRLKELEAAFAAGRPVASQPKYDGVRCFSTAAGLLSRKNTPLYCPHIPRILAPVFAAHPSIKLDGELYNHELRYDFEEITKLTRKSKISADQALMMEEMVFYYVYDVVAPVGYADRLPVLEELVELANHEKIVLTPTLWVQTQRELDMAYESYLEKGYEGQMIRLDGPYDQKRSPLLLKRKEEEDAEFVVVDITEGKGNAAGMAARFVVRLEDGSLNEAGIRFPKPKRIEFLRQRNDLIGSVVTVRFQNRTADGKLRFPRVIKVHKGGRRE